MKKLFAVLVVLVLVASVASAQLINAGPKLQLNFASFGGDNSSYYSSKTLLSFGGFATYKLDPVNLVGEVLYDQKGCSVSGGDLTEGYLGINVLVQYPIAMQGDIKPMVFAGPSLGILMSATANPGSVDVKDQMAGSDFSLILGVGASYKVGNGSVLADLRYDLGLTNVGKNSPPSNTNHAFCISVGYAFSLK